MRLMDAAGIDVQVLSHVQPGAQLLGDDQAALSIAVCQEVNDWLADAVAAHPFRLAGLPCCRPSRRTTLPTSYGAL